eukprot:SAG11_NODE_232_length_11930_cov_6.884794_8_plen_119_part_00
MSIEIVMALGLKLNTRHRVRIRTLSAGAKGDDSEHTTYGSVRANLVVAGQPLGTRTYFVNKLPGSTGVILGFNEKRKLNIDTVCSEAAAPDHPIEAWFRYYCVRVRITYTIKYISLEV